VSHAFAADDGALRVRVDESAWVGLLVAAGVSGTGSPLAPIDGVPADPGPYDAALREAAGLALGPAALRIELATTSGDRGVLGVLGCDGRAAAGAVRVVALPTADAVEAAPVPGVELSAFPAERLVAEILRTFPPDGVVLPVADGEPDVVTLPQNLAITLSRALQQGDEQVAAGIARQCGWESVPDLVRAVSEDVRASAAVTLGVVGSATVQVQRWLQCRLGWVEIGLSDGASVSRLRTREQVRQTLVESLTGAFDVLLSEGQRG
jgi:hypothetical protein